MEFKSETNENINTDSTEMQSNIERRLFQILNTINWQRFHNLCLSIGKDLNERQWRFLKGMFLETAIATYSNNELTYIGNIEDGCDFIVNNLNNLRIEMKYVEGCIFSGKTLCKKKTTTEIKLKNSNGTNTHSKLPDDYADYLLIVDLHGAGLISKDNLKKYIILGGDGIKAKIPTDSLHIVFHPNDIKEPSKKNLQLRETFMQTIDQIINSV